MFKNKGYTLLEVLIVTAIIGILSAAALASYNSYIVETRRSDAHIALVFAAAEQERIFASTRSYVSDISKLGGNTSQNKFYTIAVTTTTSGFTLNATPVSSGLQEADTDCLLITLDHLGLKLPTKCW